MEKRDLSDIEKIIERHPWYSIARLEYLKELYRLGDIRWRSYVDTVAVYFDSLPMPELLSNCEDSIKSDCVKTEESRFVVIGGDYFSNNDLSNIQYDKENLLDRFISEKSSFSKRRESIFRNEEGSEELLEEPDYCIDTHLDDPYFYTETLASIYIEQGMRSKAIEVYEKLILLYPKKSSYFASLIEDLKINN